ncbi:MAG: DinB family protein [Puia sp.]
MRLSLTYIAVIMMFSYSLQAQKNESLFLSAAITKLRHAKEYTLKVAELMPEKQYEFKPVKEEMGFGEQLLHLSANMGWLCSSYLSNSQDPVTQADLKDQKKKEIISVLNKTYDYAINVLQHFQAAHLADTVVFFAGSMNKLQIINLLNDHQTHHRAQMLVYLRLNGIKPPDYIGW